MNSTDEHLCYVDVMAEADLPEGTNCAVALFGQSILLCHLGSVFYAVANECSHQKRTLEGGRMRGTFLFCPLHGVRFDLRNGMPTGTLTRVPIETWPIRIENGRIQVGSTTTHQRTEQTLIYSSTS